MLVVAMPADAPVALVNGVAKINRSFNVDGKHVIVAEYLGSRARPVGVRDAHGDGHECAHIR
jgi:CTP:molybdopterin cytidylyltransferase MocA